MVPEFVNEDVRRLFAVGRNRAVQAKDSTAAVCARVGDDLDKLVRRERGDVSKRAIVKSQHVSLRAERIIACAKRRRAVNPCRRPRDPRFRSGGAKRPYVEVFPPFFVRRGGKQNLQESASILLELASLGRGVPVSQ